MLQHHFDCNLVYILIDSIRDFQIYYQFYVLLHYLRMGMYKMIFKSLKWKNCKYY